MNFNTYPIKETDLTQTFANKWVFLSDSRTVDVKATSSAVVINSNTLDRFCAINPDSENISKALEVEDEHIDAREVLLVILAGGLGTRSQGQVHPLQCIGNKKSQTILQAHIERIRRSVFAPSEVIILTSIFNDRAISEYCSLVAKCQTCCNGLQRRLLPCQTIGSVAFVDELPWIGFNPEGHLGALRWLYVSGILGRSNQYKTILICSYSNWGDTFTPLSLRIASKVEKKGRHDSSYLGIVEVSQKTSQKKTGSMLCIDPGHPGQFYLLKPSYGLGDVNKPCETVLMSTNTYHFHIENVLKRIQPMPLNASLLERINAFESAFPVRPYITQKNIEGKVVLQVERDLDQLTHLDDIRIEPLLVNQERSVSVKKFEQLKDPFLLEKLRIEI